MENPLKPVTARDAVTLSPWQFTRLNNFDGSVSNEPVIYDALIIGGGITGLTIGLILQQSGQQVLIAEAHSLGFGTTGGTSAHLNTFFDATYPEIEKDFGSDAAKLIAESGIEAFATIENLVKTHHIDCDFEFKDAYIYAENEGESKQLAELLESSKRAGIKTAEARENGVPVNFQLAVLVKDQGQFHPVKYLRGLADEFVKSGGTILENTLIEETQFEDDIYLAKSGVSTIKAKNLVYATHIPPGINLLHFRCAPYRSYVLGIKLKNENYPAQLVYDMQEPYHYFRTHLINGQRYLILGGEDHKTGHADPDKAFENLEAYARQYYQVDSVDFKWSAQYYVPADGLPYIGELPGGDARSYVATGFNGNGMMFGTLSGKIISDLILGKENKYAELLKPSRVKPVAGFSDFVKENADVAYHFVADRLSAAHLDSLNKLGPDTGLIVDYDDQQLAVYKDINGKISALSPVCTHAGCIVKFNPAEKSWDCPCHGGRYDPEGKVLTGPARKNLEKVKLPI